LTLSAYIPEDYVADPTTRLTLYQRMARTVSSAEVEELHTELRDRFGRLPPQLRNLLYLVKIKATAAQVKVQSITKENGQIVIRLREGYKPDPGKIGPANQGVTVQSAQVRLDTRLLGDQWQKALEDVLSRLG
jgi:transcription-repair coupling factor (superfamily II helicase)